MDLLSVLVPMVLGFMMIIALLVSTDEDPAMMTRLLAIAMMFILGSMMAMQDQRRDYLIEYIGTVCVQDEDTR